MDFMIRKAIDNDAKNVFDLSNEEYVRKNSINKEKITWEQHVKWFRAKLSDPLYVFYIVTDKEGRFIGQVRFSIEKVSAVISISITKLFRGKGLASKIIADSCKRLYQSRDRIKKIVANINTTNLSSVKSFECAGFVYKEEIVINEMNYYIYSLDLSTGRTLS